MHQLTKRISDSSTSSASGSPPLVGTSQKLEVDIDDIIARLLATKRDQLLVKQQDSFASGNQ